MVGGRRGVPVFQTPLDAAHGLAAVEGACLVGDGRRVRERLPGQGREVGGGLLRDRDQRLERGRAAARVGQRPPALELRARSRSSGSDVAISARAARSCTQSP